MFNRAFEIVVGHEGGYQNLHHDRGNWTSGVVGRGENRGTKYGVAAHAYPDLDIKNLTLDDARKIYKQNYWDKLGADKMAPALALAAFDLAINSGVGTARQLLKGVTDHRQLCALRRDFVRRLAALDPNMAKFLRGWLIRIDRIEKQCEEFAREFSAPGVREHARPGTRVFLRAAPQGGNPPKTSEWAGNPLQLSGVFKLSVFPDGAVLLEQVEGGRLMT